MTETSDYQKDSYNKFIKNPSPKNALDFVLSCHKYITIMASKWHQPNMTRKNKINEIIAEMYLILLEDFCSGKAISCQSAFAYLNSKLRRLTNPAKQHFFSDLTEISPTILSTENQFTYEKINMINEIVKIIRKNVLTDSFNNNGLVPFLFIHIYPKIHWISQMIAEKENVSPETRYEADAKRLKRFNNQLRIEFNLLANGDWREILNWSQSERRHLAWKIINISPKEVELNAADDLNLLENWRESFDIHVHQDLKKLNTAQNVYKSMSRCWPKDALMAAEESEFWGESQDIISLLITDYYDEETLIKEDAEKNSYFDSNTESFSSVEHDLEFMEVAQELNKWFGKLLAEQNKRIAENKLNW